MRRVFVFLAPFVVTGGCRSDLPAIDTGTDSGTSATSDTTGSTMGPVTGTATSGAATDTTDSGSSGTGSGGTGTSSTGGTGGTGGTGSTGSTGSTGQPSACEGAVSLNGLGSPQAGGSTVAETDDFQTSCGGAGAGDRVYGWTAPRDGWFIFDTVGSDFDTVLSLLETDCTTPIRCNDDDGAGPTSRVLHGMNQGDEIFIVVDGDGMAGTFELNIAEVECPTENLTGPLPINQAGVVTGLADVHQSGCGGAGFPELGYTYTAPSPGTYALTVVPEGGKEVSLNVYDAQACDSSLLACTVTVPFFTVAVARYLAAGQTSTFVIDALSDSDVTYDLTLNAVTCPTETLSDVVFDHPVLLPGSLPTVGGTCGGAGYGAHAIKYTATSAGSYAFQARAPFGGWRMYLLEGTGVCDGPETDCEVPTESGGTWSANIYRDLNGGEAFTIVLEHSSPDPLTGFEVLLDVNIAVP